MMTKSLDQFNREYLDVHTKKENLFWTTYMGVEKDPHALEKAETDYKAYISDPTRLKEVRASLAEAKKNGVSAEELTALKGWEDFFSAHSVESPAAQALQKELIELESTLFQKRAQLKLHYKNPEGHPVQASTVVLSMNIAASENETVRKTSHEGLLELEQWVLKNGFIELVKKRNEFARAQGFKNYFEYRVMKNERMTYDELFSILNEFEALTRETCFAHLESVKKQKGPQAILAHNLKFEVAGDAEKKLDPYLPFAKSLEIWCKSFARLGITYRQATLNLDLFDRKGKYENGFMHGPQPCFFDRGRWQPARINFTSNATPNQIGSGKKGLGTLFHEGGHAAHFANITMNAPCFSQEYPPTSMAYAETQSMFCDSLVGDGDWLKLYARDSQGNPIPDELIRLYVTSDHPFTAFQERSILVVPVFESRLYSMNEQALSAENITTLARRCEKEILGIECSPRPLMAIPHLLGAESACSYQGYLLANMAVYQTRAYFLKKYGFLCDNPEIGPELAGNYWNPGNSLTHNETIQKLTGSKLSGRELAHHCSLSNDALWDSVRKQIETATRRSASTRPIDLDARIHIVHGSEEIANNGVSYGQMWKSFENWVARTFPKA